MELFNKFRETIFLKEDSELERKILELKRSSVSDKNKLDLDIKKLEYGLKGEKEIQFELKNANLGMYVLHDINLNFEDLKAQIDYVIVTKGYTYLVECKNLIGDITVDNKGEFRREYVINGKKIKEAIYSPYTQAVRHQNILKKRWIEKNNKLTVSLLENSFDNLWYKPLVVITNSKSMLNTKFAPKHIKESTIRVDHLIEYIKKDLKKYPKEHLSTKKEMLNIANKFLECNLEKEIKIELNKNKKDYIIETLKKYRKEKSKSMNVPAYYIFTDKELELILLHNPKTLDELKNLNILSNIKIKCHGEEIIDMLNKI